MKYNRTVLQFYFPNIILDRFKSRAVEYRSRDWTRCGSIAKINFLELVKAIRKVEFFGVVETKYFRKSKINQFIACYRRLYTKDRAQRQ